MFYTTYNSPIGKIYLISDGEYLIGSYLENQKYFIKNFSNYKENDELEIFLKSRLWLDRYFNGEKPDIMKLKIKLTGTDFRKEVWDILSSIPYGKTLTYKDIGVEVCRRRNTSTMSYQAIGGAVGHNKLLIFIPCHRVIGSDGNLTGFAAGIENKKWLLNHEKNNNDY